MEGSNRALHKLPQTKIQPRPYSNELSPLPSKSTNFGNNNIGFGFSFSNTSTPNSSFPSTPSGSSTPFLHSSSSNFNSPEKMNVNSNSNTQEKPSFEFRKPFQPLKKKVKKPSVFDASVGSNVKNADFMLSSTPSQTGIPQNTPSPFKKDPNDSFMLLSQVGGLSHQRNETLKQLSHENEVLQSELKIMQENKEKLNSSLKAFQEEIAKDLDNSEKESMNRSNIIQRLTNENKELTMLIQEKQESIRFLDDNLVISSWGTQCFLAIMTILFSLISISCLIWIIIWSVSENRSLIEIATEILDNFFYDRNIPFGMDTETFHG